MGGKAGQKLVIPWYFKWAFRWEAVQLAIIIPMFIAACIFNIGCTVWLLMAMILSWISVILPLGDTYDSYQKVMQNCLKKKISSKKRSYENYRWINDLYEKYKEQTDLRVGVAIGYLIFLLIPIWLEWQDDDEPKQDYEKNCIWYWHVAFFCSIPILGAARGWEYWCKK